MGRMRLIWKRIGMVFGQKQFDEELAEELNDHIERMVEENLKAGMAPREARNHAVRRFGNRTIMQEQSKEVWIYRTIETIVQDLQYGFRMIGRTPGLTVVAVLSLALGIGANTAIFSVADALMLKMLPVKDPARLVRVDVADFYIASFSVTGASYPAYKRLRDNNKVLDGLIADGYQRDTHIVFTGSGENGQIESTEIVLVSGNYFSTLGVNPLLGRMITDEDDKAGISPPVAVISYDYWKRRFGRDPAAIGHSFTAGNGSFTIVGVTPPGFFGTEVGASPEMFAPLTVRSVLQPPAVPGAISSLDDYHEYWLLIMGRLKPGVSIEQASANLNVAYHQIVEEQAPLVEAPLEKAGYARQVLTVSSGGRGAESSLRESFSKPVAILMGIVALVLLIACVNIANLMLARGSARRKEICVRLALGAGRARLVRQLLTESAILAFFGGALGMVLALAGSGVLLRLVSTKAQPVALHTQPDLRLFAFLAGVSVLTGLLFGLVPAIRSTRINLTSGVSERAVLPGRSLGKVLFTGQIALSLLLLVGSVLFVRTFQKLRAVDLGFDPTGLYQVRWAASETGYKNQQLSAIFDQATERISKLPGVVSVSLSQGVPFGGGVGLVALGVDAIPAPEADDKRFCGLNGVDRKFFQTLGMTLIRGRGFGPEDTAKSPRVAVINETLWREYFGGADPIGKRVYRNSGWEGPIEVVGVVKDARLRDVRNEPDPVLYTLYVQNKSRNDTGLIGVDRMEIKTVGKQPNLASTIKAEIHAIDKNLPVNGVDAISDLVGDSLSRDRAITTLSVFFALLALLLVSIGLYGTLSYSVNKRTTEVGIRMALGAKPAEISWLILRDTLMMLAIGIVLGLGAAFGATRALASLLFGVTPTDTMSIVLAAAVIAGVCLIAGLVPARRAARVDPMVALRYD